MLAIVGDILVSLHVVCKVAGTNFDSADLALFLALLLLLVPPYEFRAFGAEVAARSAAQPQALGVDSIEKSQFWLEKSLKFLLEKKFKFSSLDM